MGNVDKAKFPNDCTDRIKEHCHLWCSNGGLHDVFKEGATEKPTEKPSVNAKKGCELLLSNEMEVRRKFFRKNLQPARPIRRSIPDHGSIYMGNVDKAKFPDHCTDRIKEHCHLWGSNGGLHDVFKEGATEKPTEKPSVNAKKERITYSRDFLIQISKVSLSKKKPKYLPDFPIVLRDPVCSRATDPSVPDHQPNTQPSAKPERPAWYQ
ncbi:uncharacterized protein C8orf88 homolog [Anomaloglossus baeobatrachus]|uniref:uncharacterized protein C8orf88 homolog n=1 Tax=Anomaloglossus baeobatrachus TaxID=238106 RepID=UPI003F4F92DA